MLHQKDSSFIGVSRVSRHGALLRLGPDPLSLVWVNPSKSTWVVGLGVCAEAGRGPLPEVTVPDGVSLPAGPWFGGWAFDEARSWPGFDAERWVLPEVLAFWDGERATLVAFGAAGTERELLEARLNQVVEVEPVSQRQPLRRVEEDRVAFEALVDAALGALRPGGLTKLVVARELTVEGVSPIPERVVLKALEARNPSCWTFLVRGRTGAAFIGASPELLCDSTTAIFRTEALAGTARLDEGEALLRNEKDLREHRAVVDDLRARLDGFVERLEVASEPQLKRLATVAHLHTPISAILRQGVSALQVARALHPTPAVAGVPRGPATEWLARHEGFSRGWYTGAVGARGPAGLTLAVALRSALLEGPRARVFVGAGVVKGSTPAAEWLETERKATTMCAALGVEDA